jgi:hypothetical protein
MRIGQMEAKFIFDFTRSENIISTESVKPKDAKQKLDSRKMILPKYMKYGKINALMSIILKHLP